MSPPTDSVPSSVNSDLTVDACPYRVELERRGQTVTRCQFVSDVLGTHDVELTTVSPEACQVCVQCEFPTLQQWNRVVAGFIRFGTQTLLEQPGKTHQTAESLRELQSFAISELVRTTLNAPAPTHLSRIDWLTRTRDRRCDVLIDSRNDLPDASRDLLVNSLESVLHQTEVELRAILLVSSAGEPSLPSRLRNNPRLTIQHTAANCSLLAVAVELAPSLQAPFVALHALDSISRPSRLRTAIQALLAHGGEVAAATVQTPFGPRVPLQPSDGRSSEIPWRSLVCRRSSLLDFRNELATPHLGPSPLRHDDLVARFVEHRELIVKGLIAVDQPQPQTLPQPQTRHSDRAVSPPRAVEPGPPARVDVVLPFFNTPEFVNQSLASILAQQDAEVVVHLIDDASTCSLAADIERWLSDPRVRFYRNLSNLGPYISFNNVSHFFETEFVAIQDADDVSLPHRLALGIGALHASNHEIFAGGIELFGELVDDDRALTTPGTPRSRKYWSSRYPSDARPQSLINGTVVMRTDTFRQLGGFTDYGDVSSCRCGLDTEFYSRAYYAGRSFHISRSVVLKCRRHRSSMTQNDETGWGTARRRQARERLLERLEMYRHGDFAARDFGGRDRYRELTVRVGGDH